MYREIQNHILSTYTKDSNVLGIMLFGSVARGISDKYSDIDFYILLQKKGMFERKNIPYKNVHMDIILDDIAEATDFIEQEKYGVRRNMSHMLAHGTILFAQDKRLEKLQKIAKKNLTLKTKSTKQEILMHKYSIDDFFDEMSRNMKKRDYIAFGLNSNLLMQNILELFLKTKKSFFLQPNEIHTLLVKLDPVFAEYVKQFYSSKNLSSIKTIVEKCIKHVYKISGGSLPQKWEIRN